MAPHAMNPRIVGGERQRQISVVQVHQVPQLFRPASDVLEGIVRISNPQRGGRVRRELHEPHCALTRHGMLAKAGLDSDDGSQERRFKSIPLRVVGDGSADLLLTVSKGPFVVRLGRCRKRNDTRSRYDSCEQKREQAAMTGFDCHTNFCVASLMDLFLIREEKVNIRARADLR